MFRDGDCLTGAAAMKAKDNTMKNREPTHIPSDVPSRGGHKKSTKQKRGHNTASYFKMAEPGTCSTEQESRNRVMINNNERKIKKADRTTTRDGQRNQFLSAKGLDLVERFYLQYDKLRRLGEQAPVPGTIWNSKPEREENLFGPMLLVLKAVDLDSGPEFLVAEVSDCIDQATETDLVLSSDESSLPFNCMIRAGNTFWTTSNWFKDCIGEIDSSMWQEVLRFAFSAQKFDDDISPLDYQFVEIDGTTLMRREGATSGLPNTEEEDSRFNFLQESIKKCQYLSHDVTVSRTQPKLDQKQVYDRLWMGNKSFPLEPSESNPTLLKIKGRLVLQDITVPIYKEKATGGSRLLRIEGQVVPPIEAPLAAFEDLRDNWDRCVDLNVQARSFSPYSCPEFPEANGEQTLRQNDLHLGAVLACRAKYTEVRILSDDSTNAIFLQLTPVKDKMKRWLTAQRIGMASSITTMVPPRSKSFTLASVILMEHLFEDSDGSRDLNFFHSLPPAVLELLTKASQQPEAGEALNRISALGKRALHSILNKGVSSPSIAERAQIWAYYLLLTDTSPKDLIKIGRRLFGRGKAWKEIDSSDESLQEIFSSLRVLRDPATTTEDRCDSIAKLAGILGSAPSWKQVENILYCNQFCWPPLIVDLPRPGESNRATIVSLPVAIDVSFDYHQDVRLLREESCLTPAFESNLRKCIDTAKALWKQMHKDDSPSGYLVEKASVISDVRIAEKIVADLPRAFDRKISLSDKSAHEHFVQAILSRLLGHRDPMKGKISGGIVRQIKNERGVKPPSSLFEGLRSFLEKIDDASTARVFTATLSNGEQLKPKVSHFLRKMNNLVQEEKGFIPADISSQFYKTTEFEISCGDDLKVNDIESSVATDYGTYIAEQPRHTDEGPPNSAQCESTYLRGTVYFLEEQGSRGIIRSTNGEEFSFGESDLGGGLNFRDVFNGMPVCFQIRMESEGTKTRQAINVSCLSPSLLKGTICVVEDGYGFICAPNGREYYFNEFDLHGGLRFDNLAQGIEVYFQVRKEPSNSKFAGAATNVTSRLVAEHPYA